MTGKETNGFGIILEESEQIVHNWKGIYFANMSRSGALSGYLVLTNRRLVWCQERGLFTRTVFVAFDFRLREIKGISISGEDIYITGESGAKWFRLPKVGNEELSVFKEMILRQKENESRATH